MAITIEQAAVQNQKRASQNTKRVMTHLEIKTGAPGESPYTAKNLDGAIAHLEIVVAVDDNIAVFGRRYWRDRVERIASTPQIVPAQARRLQLLLDQLGEG